MKRSPNSYVGALWYKNQQNMLLDGLYHEDIAVLGQFYAEFISYSLSPEANCSFRVKKTIYETNFTSVH